MIPELNPIEFVYRDISKYNKMRNVQGSSKGFVKRIVESYQEVTAMRTRKYFLSSDKFAKLYEEGTMGKKYLQRWLS